MARQSDKLVTCLLEPVQLLPPFNVIHTEDLITWAGQEYDPSWLKLPDHIGELPGPARPLALQPGDGGRRLAGRAAVMGAGQWDDPLVNTVWHQIHQREGEDQSARIERERAEAAAAAKQIGRAHV